VRWSVTYSQGMQYHSSDEMGLYPLRASFALIMITIVSTNAAARPPITMIPNETFVNSPQKLRISTGV
jgi:hypothetical protein